MCTAVSHRDGSCAARVFQCRVCPVYLEVYKCIHDLLKYVRSICRKILDDSVNIIFSSSIVKYAIQTVTINNFSYAKDTIIIIDSSDETPMFEKMCKIFVVDNEIVFQYIKLSTIGFNTHYFAYSVTFIDDKEHSIAYNLLTNKLPCLLFEQEDALFIVARHLL